MRNRHISLPARFVCRQLARHTAAENQQRDTAHGTVARGPAAYRHAERRTYLA